MACKPTVQTCPESRGYWLLRWQWLPLLQHKVPLPLLLPFPPPASPLGGRRASLGQQRLLMVVVASRWEAKWLAGLFRLAGLSLKRPKAEQGLLSRGRHHRCSPSPCWTPKPPPCSGSSPPLSLSCFPTQSLCVSLMK